MYSRQVLDHFQNPRNSGELEGADVTVQAENPACGDILRLTAVLDNDRLSRVRFRARGCVATIACASVLTELVAEKTVEQARLIRREQLLEELGELPPESMHASHLAVDALQLLLRASSARLRPPEST